MSDTLSCSDSCCFFRTEPVKGMATNGGCRCLAGLTHRQQKFIRDIRRENAELRKVCAEAYQVAGCAGAPVRVLDNLACAANNRPIPHETMLPVLMDEFDEANSTIRELRKKLEQAHAALNIADDYLRCHWDMQTVPLIEISAAIAATEPPK